MSRLSSGLVWPQAGDVAFFQVVKTAQSRGRTERTLVKALSQFSKDALFEVFGPGCS
jgi:hypothetical protein